MRSVAQFGLATVRWRGRQTVREIGFINPSDPYMLDTFPDIFLFLFPYINLVIKPYVFFIYK